MSELTIPKWLRDYPASHKVAYLAAKKRIWLASHHHTTTRGKPLDFTRFSYLKALYADTSPNVTLMCGVQSGKTEWISCDIFALVSMGLSYQLVQPKDDLRVLFHKTRIRDPIKRSPFYSQHMTSDGAMYTWKNPDGNNGTLRVAFSNREDEFISFPADAVGVDEVDKCDLNNLSLLPDRLMGSPYGPLYRRSSTPTTVGNDQVPNINYHFCQTDKREWYIECDNCHTEQPIDWLKNVVDEQRDPNTGKLLGFRLRDEKWNEDLDRDIYPMCMKCGSPLDRLKEGKWYPTAKVSRMSARRGYHLNKLTSPLVKIRDLWEGTEGYQYSANNPTKLQRFFNSILGLPYVGSGTQITEEMLKNCMGNYYIDVENDTSYRPCSMGVDVGPEWLDVRISVYPSEKKNIRQAVYIGKVRDFDDLHRLIRRFNVRTCVVDAEPEVRGAITFQLKANCTVYLAYTREVKGQTISDMLLEKVRKGNKLTLDRTLWLDGVLECYQSRKVVLPQNIAFLSEGLYISEMTNPTRVLEVDDRGNQKWVWTSGNDHSLLADAYDLAASYLGNFYAGPTGAVMSPRPQTMVSAPMETFDIMEVFSSSYW